MSKSRLTPLPKAPAIIRRVTTIAAVASATAVVGCGSETHEGYPPQIEQPPPQTAPPQVAPDSTQVAGPERNPPPQIPERNPPQIPVDRPPPDVPQLPPPTPATVSPPQVPPPQIPQRKSKPPQVMQKD